MGKSHEAPESNTSIELDANSKGSLIPGSRISGHVTLQTSAHTQINSATIQLFGHAVAVTAKSELINGQPVVLKFVSEEPLFRIQQPLAEAVDIRAGTAQKWPFEVQLPQSTCLGRDAMQPYAGDARYQGAYTTEDHPLPPSFAMVSGPNSSAKVEYNIQGQFDIEGEKEPLVVQLDEPLCILPAPDAKRGSEEHRLEFIKTAEKFSSSRLTGDSKPSRKPSFLDKLSHSGPSVEIVIKASVPTVLNTGDSFNIQAAVELQSPSSSDVSVPTVNIAVKKLQLHDITHLRAVRSNTGDYSGHRVRETRLSEAVTLNAQPPHLTVDRERESKDKLSYSASFQARVPGTTCPTFSTVNISHSFQLGLTVEAEACGKKFEYEVEVPDVVVLPPA